jgi:hypothetical protein
VKLTQVGLLFDVPETGLTAERSRGVTRHNMSS